MTLFPRTLAESGGLTWAASAPAVRTVRYARVAVLQFLIRWQVDFIEILIAFVLLRRNSRKATADILAKLFLLMTTPLHHVIGGYDSGWD